MNKKKVSKYLFAGELMIPFSRIKKTDYNNAVILNGDLEIAYISINKLRKDLKLISVNIIGNEKIINYKIENIDNWRF